MIERSNRRVPFKDEYIEKKGFCSFLLETVLFTITIQFLSLLITECYKIA